MTAPLTLASAVELTRDAESARFRMCGQSGVENVGWTALRRTLAKSRYVRANGKVTRQVVTDRGWWSRRRRGLVAVGFTGRDPGRDYGGDPFGFLKLVSTGFTQTDDDTLPRDTTIDVVVRRDEVAELHERLGPRTPISPVFDEDGTAHLDVTLDAEGRIVRIRYPTDDRDTGSWVAFELSDFGSVEKVRAPRLRFTFPYVDLSEDDDEVDVP